jgi:putative transcriptional regulator
MEHMRGQLLVAAPTLLDPNFWRTVVLVAEHGEMGALGLVLNRASDVPVRAAAPELERLVDEDDVVHVGGPVQPDGLIVVAEWDEDEPGALGILPGIGILTAGMDPAEARPRRARVFAGHAGWAPAQLESEVGRTDWYLDRARPEDVFAADTDHLWSSVLARKGGHFRVLARMPADPSVN